MRLSGKILKNVVDVNHWRHSSQAFVAEGQINYIYVQLVDLDQSTKSTNEQSDAFPQFPIRYLSQSTVMSVRANFLNIDEESSYEINASQPFSEDRSIWKFTLNRDQIPAAGNLKITVREDGHDRTFVIRQAIHVDLIDQGGC